MADVSWRILEGDCRTTLANLPAGSVQTCVTSPPYFGLRSYGGGDAEIGTEPTPDEFVAALVEVFRDVRRVLRDDGTVWLNLGDSYTAGAGSRNGQDSSGLKRNVKDETTRLRCLDENKVYRAPSVPGVSTGVKPKDLIGIPWAVAFALRADGWYLRSDIIWNKPNPMPESVTDRPTKSHEYVFLLSKGPRYFYDADAIRETFDAPEGPRGGIRNARPGIDVNGGNQANGEQFSGDLDNGGRNKRSVWTVATQPYAGAHFATFPAKLIEPCILAGTSPRACGVCGAPWRRVVDGATYYEGDDGQRTRKTNMVGNGHGGGGRGPKDNLGASIARTVGWESSCAHDDDTGTCVVLDPFAGSGTTGLVALRHDRSFIGCELSPAYVDLARDRIIADSPLLNTHAEAA
jgi:DNA modification methylase